MAKYVVTLMALAITAYIDVTPEQNFWLYGPAVFAWLSAAWEWGTAG